MVLTVVFYTSRQQRLVRRVCSPCHGFRFVAKPPILISLALLGEGGASAGQFGEFSSSQPCEAFDDLVVDRNDVQYTPRIHLTHGGVGAEVAHVDEDSFDGMGEHRIGSGGERALDVVCGHICGRRKPVETNELLRCVMSKVAELVFE